MKSLLIMTTGFALLAAATGLASAETLTASFLYPDGGVTVDSYKGIVDVTVSGVGQSLGPDYNDAFYVYTAGPPYNDPSYYQLTFGTTTLVAFDPAQDAKNFLVGGLPAYEASHVYSFELNTGLSSPGQLHFGVGDGDFSDNSGFYTITVMSVPEPATWAMMLIGFAGLGIAGYRATKKNRAAFA